MLGRGLLRPGRLLGAPLPGLLLPGGADRLLALLPIRLLLFNDLEVARFLRLLLRRLPEPARLGRAGRREARRRRE